MKKMLDWDQVLGKLYKKRETDGYDPYNLQHTEIFKALEDCFDEESENGWNLVCFIDDKTIPTQFGFLFEKSTAVYNYSVVFLDEIMEEAVKKWRHAGTEYSNEIIAKVLDNENILTPMYIPSLRYSQDSEGKFFTLPIYICRWLDKTTSARKKLYIEYQTATKKNAIFRGNETKAFLEWLKVK